MPGTLLALALGMGLANPALAQISSVSVPAPLGLSIAPDGAVWVGLYSTGAFAVLSPYARTVTATFPTAPKPTAADFYGNLAIFASEYAGTVYAIDRTTGATQWTFKIPSTVIANVAVSPTGIGYATSDPGRLTAFNPATGVIFGHMTTGARPRGIAFSADGSIIAVANEVANALDIIDASAMAITHVVPVGAFPRDVVTNGMFAYASNYNDATVSKVNIETGTVTATAAVGLNPRRLATNENRLFVSNQGSNSVSILNVSTMATIRTIPIGGSPRDIAVNPAGTRLFVANKSGNAVYTYNVASVRGSCDACRGKAAAPLAPPRRSNNVKGALVDFMFVLAEWRF